MKDKWLLHKKIVTSLNEIESAYFPDIKIGDLLYSEIWYMLAGRTMDVKQYLSQKDEIISFQEGKKDILVISYYRGRKERDNYWKLIEANLIGASKITIIPDIAGEDICKYRENLNCYEHIYDELSCVDESNYRKQLAAVLVKQYNYLNEVNFFLADRKVMLCYFSGGYYENILMQVAKALNIITISFQHGQPILRNVEEDPINQAQIINCLSDYFVCMNTHTALQFGKIGKKKVGLPVIGNFNTSVQEFSHVDSGIFGVFLDSPQLPFYKSSNSALIIFALDFAKKNKFRFFVKPHPSDKTDYSYINGSFASVLSNDEDASAYMSKFEFAICHASSVYLDFYINGVLAYVWGQDGFDYELTDIEDDYIFDVEGLEVKLLWWKKMDMKSKKSEYEKRRNHLLNSNGVTERFAAFMDNIVGR